MEGARQLADVLTGGDRRTFRRWVDWALNWYARNRPMALAARKPSSAEDKPTEAGRPPWSTWSPGWRRGRLSCGWKPGGAGAELCRVQMHTYMWGRSHTLFADQELPVDLFTEIWWATLIAPRPAHGCSTPGG